MSAVKNDLRRYTEITFQNTSFFSEVVPERKIFSSKHQYNLPKLPLGGTESNRVENHTIVIEAMCDLVTDYHADATIVERFSLAFAEERRLEDTCREH